MTPVTGIHSYGANSRGALLLTLTKETFKIFKQQSQDQ